MSADKTLITHAREEKARFLNYAISTSWNNTAQCQAKGGKRRSVNGGIRLEIPKDVISTWIDRVQNVKTTKDGEVRFITTHRAGLLNNSDYDIITAYETRIQGLIN